MGETKKKQILGTLINRNNSPRNIQYDKSEFVMSPRQKIKNLDKKLFVGKLPRSVIFIKQSN